MLLFLFCANDQGFMRMGLGPFRAFSWKKPYREPYPRTSNESCSEAWVQDLPSRLIPQAQDCTFLGLAQKLHLGLDKTFLRWVSSKQVHSLVHSGFNYSSVSNEKNIRLENSQPVLLQPFKKSNSVIKNNRPEPKTNTAMNKQWHNRRMHPDTVFNLTWVQNSVCNI